MKQIRIIANAIGVMMLSLCLSVVSLAGYEEGEEAIAKGDRETAFFEFHQAANAGDSRAFGKLGTLYLYGAGTKKNFSKAYIWLSLATESGDRYAERFRDAAGAALPVSEIEKAEKKLIGLRKEMALKQLPAIR